MTSPTAQRYVLLPSPRAEDRDAQYRRYRLARLRMDELRRDTSGPYGHLKRAFD